MKRAWHNFIVFLHKEGVYKEYLNEFHKHCLKNSIPIQEHIESLKDKADIFFLAFSFHWDKTIQGPMFWSYINRKWCSYRNELA